MALRDILLRFFDREIDRFKRLSGWFLQLRDQNIQHSIIAGWDGSDMRMVGVTRTNAMIVNDSPVRGSLSAQAPADSSPVYLGNTDANWVTIHPRASNTGDVFVAVGTAPTLNTEMLLVKGQYHTFPVNNLNDIQIIIQTSGDRIDVVWG